MFRLTHTATRAISSHPRPLLTIFSRFIHITQRRNMSSNQYERANGPDGTAPATTTIPQVLTQNSVSRFLSPDYRIPYPPLTRTLSFNDTHTWPLDPMEVFSQWYCDGEFAYNTLSPNRMDAPIHWPNTMQISTVSHSGFPSLRTVLLKGYDSRGFIFFTNYEGQKGRELLNDGRVALQFYWKTLERQVRVQGRAEQLSEEESDRYFHQRPIGSQISGTVSPQSRRIDSHTELEEHYVETVQEVAKHVQALLEGASGDEAQIAATKARVTQLLGALSAKKNAVDVVHAQSPTAGHPSTEESLKAAAAHQEALSSLQRLESSPVTAPLLAACVRRPKYWGGFLIRPTQIEYWCDGAYRLHSRIVYEREGGLEQEQPKGNTNEVAWKKRFLAP